MKLTKDEIVYLQAVLDQEAYRLLCDTEINLLDSLNEKLDKELVENNYEV